MSTAVTGERFRLPAPYRAGMFRKRVAYGSGGRTLPVTFWYPASAEESRRRDGIYDLRAAFDAAPAPGRYGLVVVSHGSGGSDVNHHDWAEALARAGYVVAAPRHVGDSHDVNHGIGSREQLLERPRQLKAALHAALEDDRLGGLIDRDRIGVMGFSAGGYTSLILLGARPDFSRWTDYCGLHPEAVVVCPVGKALSLPKPTDEDWRNIREPLLKAAVLLAPFAMLFDRENLGKIGVPVRLYRAEDEAVVGNPANADVVAENLRTPPEAVTVEGGHYVFIAPIEDILAKKYPEFYVDPSGIDRRALHARLAGEIVDFFDRALP